MRAVSRIKKMLRSERGPVSRREVLFIFLIALMSLFFAVEGGNWYRVRIERGNDKMMVNTAESVALINSGGGMSCVVGDCPGGGSGGTCSHWNGRVYVGYFDHVGNRIVGQKTEGYNENPVMEADGQTYYGSRGTMVIRAECGEGEVRLSWVEGKK